MANEITMIICGDTVPTQSNFAEFANADRKSYLSDAVWEKMENADFRFINLEVPLCDEERPIVKCGPNLIAPTSTVKGIKAMNPDLIGLANNHTLDQDKEGLFSTFDVLSENGLSYIGAGKNLKEAQKPYIFEKNGIRIGIYNCAEHEFTIADENAPGANPFDVFDSPDHIRALKAECDFVVVIYHGCKEHYRYPSPKVQKACRKMVDCGADLVVGQHSHCVGCEERYKEGVIVYGQGNFIFDHLSNEFWKTGMLVKATFGEKLEVEYIPLRQENKGIGLGEKEIIDGFFERSEEIKRPGFIKESYEKYALSMMDEYFVMLEASDGERFSNELFSERLKEKDHHKKYDISILAAMENLFRCEAHSELIQTALHKITDSGKYHG